MSLSICDYCGGHIPLGPDASNLCDGCGRSLCYMEAFPPVAGIEDSELVSLRAEVARLRKELTEANGDRDKHSEYAGRLADACLAIEDERDVLKNEVEALKKIERQRWENVNQEFGTNYSTARDYMGLPMNVNDFGTRRPGDF